MNFVKPKLSPDEAARRAEFIRVGDELKKRFGFKQKDIAAAARVSGSLVSQIYQWKPPGQRCVEDLQARLRDLTEPEAKPTDTRGYEMGAGLAYLQKHAPEKYNAFKTLIDTTVKGVSSDVASAAKATQDAASDAAEREHRESQRKHPTGEPTSDKRARGRAASRGSSKPPEPPGPAPK